MKGLLNPVRVTCRIEQETDVSVVARLIFSASAAPGAPVSSMLQPSIPIASEPFIGNDFVISGFEQLFKNGICQYLQRCFAIFLQSCPYVSPYNSGYFIAICEIREISVYRWLCLSCMGKDNLVAKLRRRHGSSVRMQQKFAGTDLWFFENFSMGKILNFRTEKYVDKKWEPFTPPSRCIHCCIHPHGTGHVADPWRAFGGGSWAFAASFQSSYMELLELFGVRKR
jgi:hypothetical protein